MGTPEMSEDQVYKTEYGSFTIHPTRFMFKSTSVETGKDLVFGLTADAVYQMTPTHLQAHALGLKEERSYDGVVGGKL